MLHPEVFRYCDTKNSDPGYETQFDIATYLSGHNFFFKIGFPNDGIHHCKTTTNKKHNLLCWITNVVQKRKMLNFLTFHSCTKMIFSDTLTKSFVPSINHHSVCSSIFCDFRQLTVEKGQVHFSSGFPVSEFMEKSNYRMLQGLLATWVLRVAAILLFFFVW